MKMLITQKAINILMSPIWFGLQVLLHPKLYTIIIHYKAGFVKEKCKWIRVFSAIATAAFESE